MKLIEILKSFILFINTYLLFQYISIDLYYILKSWVVFTLNDSVLYNCHKES